MNAIIRSNFRRRVGVAVLALLVSPLAAWAQRTASRSGMPPLADPGRIIFDVGNLAKKAVKYDQVSLDRSMLRMFLNSQKGPMANMLSGLRGVYVQDLKFARPGEYSMTTVTSIARQLRNPAWITIVRSRSARENVWVCVQRDREMITALAVVDAKPKELALVNIVGPIRLNELGSLSGLSGINLSKLGPHPMLHARPVQPPSPAPPSHKKIPAPPNPPSAPTPQPPPNPAGTH